MPGLVQKFKEMWSPNEEYEEEYTEQENEPENTYYRSKNKEKKASSGKVVSIHATAKLKVVLSKPEKFEEKVKYIGDEVSEGHVVVLNLGGVNETESRRIIDFLSGAAYALGGKIKKVSDEIFVITPYNVDLEGDDVLDELENRGLCF